MKRLMAVAIRFSRLLSLAGPAFADTQYVVQPRDTLFRIALHFGTTVSALAQANHITNPNRIFVGQVLTISGPKPTGHLTRYVVRRGDTRWRIAHIFGTSVAAIQAANRLSSALIFAGQVLLRPIK